jgi:hypothetical protein
VSVPQYFTDANNPKQAWKKFLIAANEAHLQMSLQGRRLEAPKRAPARHQRAK